MNSYPKSHILIVVTMLLTCISCNRKAKAEVTASIAVPVTVTHIDTTGIESYTDLNATTTYLIKNTIKANTTGYLETVSVASNDYVNKGQALFSLKTRESKVLGNTVNKIDPSLNFGRAIVVRATSNGYVTAVNLQQGDYVQEGDALAVINNAASFCVLLSLPYELKRYVQLNEVLTAYLPDGTAIRTKAAKFLQTVDAASQTQGVILKCTGTENLPENLVVKVRINKTSGSKTISLPKAAVLSDETETDFWVMKMANDTTAVKIPIKKGIETAYRVAILSPAFKPSDRILLTGNYGVGDIITVKIVKK